MQICENAYEYSYFSKIIVVLCKFVVDSKIVAYVRGYYLQQANGVLPLLQQLTLWVCRDLQNNNGIWATAQTTYELRIPGMKITEYMVDLGRTKSENEKMLKRIEGIPSGALFPVLIK